MNFDIYRTIIFDCDGVILNSNFLKTTAFERVAGVYGQDIASRLVDFHKLNAGASRYEKFQYLLDVLLQTDHQEDAVHDLCRQFAEIIQEDLTTCEMSKKIPQLRNLLKGAIWLVVSGSDQIELRNLLMKRGISHLFDGGVFGSPKKKIDILSDLKENGSIKGPVLYIGDSRYDHKAARAVGFDFLFVSGWTEFNEWRQYIDKYSIPHVHSLDDLFFSILKSKVQHGL